MEIWEAQTAIEKFRCSDTLAFLGAVGGLIDALMATSGDDEWSGKFAPYTDGVLFEYRDSEPYRFIGDGVAVIGPKQYIEPVSVEFRFDAVSGNMTAGTIYFGMIDPTKPGYGSSEHRKIAQSVLAKALSARPKIELKWKHRFRLTDGAWSSEALG